MQHCVSEVRCSTAVAEADDGGSLVLVTQPWYTEFISCTVPPAGEQPRVTVQAGVVLQRSALEDALSRLPRQTRDRARRSLSQARVTQNFQATSAALNQETDAQVHVMMQRLDEQQLGRIPEEEDVHQAARSSARALVHKLHLDSVEAAQKQGDAARKIQAAWRAFKTTKVSMIQHINKQAFRTSFRPNSYRIRDRTLQQKAPKLLFSLPDMQSIHAAASQELARLPSLFTPEGPNLVPAPPAQPLDPSSSTSPWTKHHSRYGSVAAKYLELRKNPEKQQPQGNWQLGSKPTYASQNSPASLVPEPSFPRASKGFPACSVSCPALQLNRIHSMPRQPAPSIPAAEPQSQSQSQSQPQSLPVLRASQSLMRRDSRHGPSSLMELTPVRSRNPAASDPGHIGNREHDGGWTAELDHRQLGPTGAQLQPRRYAISLVSVEAQQTRGAADANVFSRSQRPSPPGAGSVRTSWPSSRQQVSAPQYQNLMAKFSDTSLVDCASETR